MPSRIIDISNLQTFTAVNLMSDGGAVGGKVQIPQCAQIVLTWNLEGGKTGHNVFYGRYAGTFSGSAAQATAILTALASGGSWTALAAFLATTTQLNNVTIRDVNVIDQPLVGATTGAAPGTSASPALPSEVAAVITLRTAKTGPQNRGRAYIPGFATNSLGTGNIIAAAAVTALQNWANTIPGILSAQGYTWVIGQKKRQAYTGITGTQHPARDATSIQISSQPVRDNHWDTQRRRGLK